MKLYLPNLIVLLIPQHETPWVYATHLHGNMSWLGHFIGLESIKVFVYQNLNLLRQSVQLCYITSQLSNK